MSVGKRDKTVFLIRNLLRGLLWLFLIILAFILIKKYVNKNYITWLEPLYDDPFLIYLIYSCSELIFGLIPPEVFMIWGLRSANPHQYILTVCLLTSISYAAGLITYSIGRYLHATRLYNYLMEKLWHGLEDKLNRYGILLVIVAALTPVPYSGTCMLVGAVKMPFKKFLFYSLSRIARFAAYAPIVWEANIL